MARYVSGNVEAKAASGHEVLEGDWTPSRGVVLEGSSVEPARRWDFSDEYKPAKAIRRRTAVSSLVIAEGA